MINLWLTYGKRLYFTKLPVLTSKRNSFGKPWITTGIAKACKDKNRLHNKWIKPRGSPVEDNSKKE